MQGFADLLAEAARPVNGVFGVVAFLGDGGGDQLRNNILYSFLH